MSDDGSEVWKPVRYDRAMKWLAVAFQSLVVGGMLWRALGQNNLPALLGGLAATGCAAFVIYVLLRRQE